MPLAVKQLFFIHALKNINLYYTNSVVSNIDDIHLLLALCGFKNRARMSEPLLGNVK